MKIVQEIAFSQCQLAMQDVQKLADVLAEHLFGIHLHGAFVGDDRELAGDRGLASCEGIERLDGLVLIGARRKGDFNADLLRREIADRADCDLLLLDRLFNRADHRFGGLHTRKLRDKELVDALFLDARTDLDSAKPLVVFADIHDPARLEIGHDVYGSRLLLRLLDDLNLCFQQLDEVVRQNAGGQAHGDALGAEHQEQRELGRQGHRLLVASVVARNKVGQILVEQFVARQFGQTTLNISRRRRIVACEDVAEVALAFNEIALVGQCDQRVTDGGVAMRVVLHRMAHHVGDFDEASVVLFLECIEDTTLDRLETVGDVGNGPFADDIGSVLQKVEVDQFGQRPMPFIDGEVIVWRWGFIVVTAAGGFHLRCG